MSRGTHGRLCGPAAASVLLGCLLLAAPALANTTVTVSSKCTLPHAVAYADGTSEPGCHAGTASGATTIVVPARAHAYTAPSTLDVTAPTIIKGAGAAGTVISGGGKVEVFDVTSTATIQRLTITGGVSGVATTGCTGSGPTRACPAEAGLDGGGITNTGKLTLQNDVVSGNATSAGTRPTTISGSCFSGCQGATPGDSGSGGGIYNAGSLTVRNSTITHNHAANGASGTAGTTASGGGPGEIGGAGGAGGWGGGIYSAYGAKLLISNSTISDNTAGSGGNGGPGSSATVSGANGGAAGPGGAGGPGGGIYTQATTVIRDSTIAGNRSGAGGYGASGGSSENANYGANSSGGFGGDGGGIYDHSVTSVSLTNVTLVDNLAQSGGLGGCECDEGLSGSGGGLMQDIGSLNLRFVTVAGNTAGTFGDGFGAYDGTVKEANSIVAENYGSVAVNCSILPAATMQNGGHNIDFGDPGSNCPGSHLNPRLGPLAANGGPTETMALGAGSGAIGLVPAADCSPRVDQRGVSRPVNDCDAGAYQRPPPKK